jgi:hypothetical protein
MADALSTLSNTIYNTEQLICEGSEGLWTDLETHTGLGVLFFSFMHIEK